MFCSNCGSKVNEGSKFCPECGTAVLNQIEEAENVSENNSVDNVGTENSVVAPKLDNEIVSNSADSNEVNTAPQESLTGSYFTPVDSSKTNVLNDLSKKVKKPKDKKKTIIIVAVIIAFLFVIAKIGGGDGNTATSEEIETAQVESYQIYFDIESSSNVLFSTYDIEIYIDDTKLGNVANGKNFTSLTEAKEGEHTIYFYKNGEHSVSTKEVITLNKDSTFKCTLTSKSDEITTTNVEFIESVSNLELEVVNVEGLNLAEAVSKLEGIGFVNIVTTTNDGSTVFEKSNWKVDSQSVSAGTKTDKNTEITLMCSRTETTTNEEAEEITEETTEKNKESKSSETKKETTTKKITTTKATTKRVTTTRAKTTANSVSLGKQNALKKAKSYLDFSAFSKSGLEKQLDYEGFTSEEIKYAVDNCGADWNAQALKKAKSYLDYSAFSKSGLKEQLEYEGFTDSQSTYGVNNCGANWNEQAAKKAKSYLEYSSFSKEGLIDQLIYEGFTSEQAAYGVKAVGY